MHPSRIERLGSFYRDYLLDNVIPFWMEHSIDREHGGYLTCLDRRGDVYNYDKSVWFQGRGAWLFSRLHNAVEKRPEWLEAAKTGVDFLNAHCFDGDGRMFFTVTRDGRPLQKRRYVFSEAFAAIALAEYAKASGDEGAMLRAKRIFETVKDIYQNGRMIPKIDPNTRKMQSHALPMILLSTMQALRENGNTNEYDAFAGELLRTLFTDFMKPEERALFETVGEQGERLDSPQGRCVNPGHAIETSWFLMREGLYRKDNGIIRDALNILEWSLELGWDKEYGGIFAFVDIEGKPPEQLEWDMKLWWPHTEALHALLLAHSITGDPKYEEWHDDMHSYAFGHFADMEHNEWYGYLHRDGTISNTLKGSLWKGMFHLPRALLLNWKLLEGMADRKGPIFTGIEG
jgi:N-acylglucosamine 2-epimerase